MRHLATLSLLLLLVGVAACGGGDRPRDSTYVALGDSYTSAPDLAPVEDALCQRSGANYPHLLAERLRLRNFVDASCGGAATAHLSAPQRIGAFTRAPQLSALTRRTSLVTLGIGLNDGAVARRLLYDCLPVRGTYRPACAQLVALPDADFVRAAEDLGTAVTEAAQLVRARAPRARVVLVGYPRFVPDRGSCPDRWPVPGVLVGKVRVFQAALSSAYRKAARTAGVRYADLYTASRGHDLCSAEPWVNGAFRVPGKAAAMHPFGVEQRAAARAVLRALDD